MIEIAIEQTEHELELVKKDLDIYYIKNDISIKK